MRERERMRVRKRWIIKRKRERKNKREGKRDSSKFCLISNYDLVREKERLRTKVEK